MELACLRCILFEGSFHLVMFAVLRAISCGTMRECAAAEVKVFGDAFHSAAPGKNCRSFELHSCFFLFGKLSAWITSDHFEVQMEKFHLPKSVSGTPIKVLWALISN